MLAGDPRVQAGKTGMQDGMLTALADEVEAAGRAMPAMAERLREALGSRGLAVPDQPAEAEAALALVAAALPGWEISLDGRASRELGEWTCALRRSRARDSDEAIGIGRGQRMGPALLAALLRALAAGARA